MPTAQSPERTALPAGRMPWLSGVPRRVAVGAIRGYKYFLSPFFGQHCRFHPTCSSYAIEALQRFGALRGGWMTLRRLSRCHPWCSGGVDLVPAPRCELESTRDPARC